ncbi:putative development/cell death domain-containing protein [Medicago truncatula]|uniref:Putative development/cell death domain-containing protein n=2 Tax=Medicago truncatula TaxID=3880 RepID=A0A396I779_MEDTR|nr:putative development/cell death domain-containing protein [Medicago truncatula]
MYIDPYAWINDDYSDETQYPAQVKVRVGLQCRPLSEDKFERVIAENYYDNNHFWFELDRSQTTKLMYLLASTPIAPDTYVPRYNTKWRSVRPCPSYETMKKDQYTQQVHTHPIKTKVNEGEKNRIHKKLLKLALGKKNQDLSFLDNINGVSDEKKIKGYIEAPPDLDKNEDNNSSASFKNLYTIIQSVQQDEELKAFQKTHSQKNGHLEQKLMKSSLKIHHVKDNCKKFECTNIEKTAIQSFEYEDAIKYFQPMNSLGLYTSQIQVKVDGITTNEIDCFTNVDIVNLDHKRWISLHSNVDKKFEIATMEPNGSLYTNGACKGFDYLKYTIGGFDEYTMVSYMELFDPCLELRMELMNYLEDFYSAIDIKESMGSRESKFLKTF